MAKKTEMKHTSGPWFLCEQVERPHQHALVGIGNGAVHVGYASITPAMSPFEADANARLIAAAPELLETLDALVHKMEMHLENRGLFCLITDDARAAIAKAKGETE